MKNENVSSRRNFMGTMAAGAAGLSILSNPLMADIPTASGAIEDAEAWFKKIKGKHKIVYDAPEPHEGFPIIWSWVFYKTNNQTGTIDNELTAMVVLRHNAIPIAMEDRLWEKYKFGEGFKINEPGTSAPAVKNPYWMPDAQMWIDLGVDGIKKLQARGAMFCVCDMALTVYSMMTAKAMNLNPDDVKKDWMSGLLPGIQVVPSGVWAIGRAQEKGCAYCFAG
jgi:intracellular sulfur oxidation DsrE/DsrF family protein